MTTLVFTAYDDKYAPLAKLTVPRMERWAAWHDADFDVMEKAARPTQDGIYWTKFVSALEYLRGHNYDRIIWLDADQMITNPDFKFVLPFHGFHVSKDWGFDATEPWHFSVCGFVAHQDCIPLFEEVLTMEPEARGKPFPEQEPMRQVIRKKIEGGEAFLVHGPRFLNAVPNEVCPGKVVHPWQPGDFAAHLTMLPIEKRIELFHEIKKQAGV